MASQGVGVKDIAGYEGLYKISSAGYVIAMPRHGTRCRTPYALTGGYDQCGYRVVTLTKNGHGKTHRIHRLVANAFIQNPLGLREVNHKDENKDNNAASNLEWCSRAYNVRYGSRTQRTRKRVDQLSIDGTYIKTFEGLGIAAASVGASSVSNISDCCNGKRKTAFKYKWRWAE